MKQLITLIIVSIIRTLNTFGQECKKLDDGIYYFKHKTKAHGEANFLLTINGDEYLIEGARQEYSKGKIEWWSDNCKFRLNSGELSIIKNEVDSLDNLQKTDSIKLKLPSTDGSYLMKKTFLSYGGHCYQLITKKKFRLTYCGNSHVTISEGYIIKQ